MEIIFLSPKPVGGARTRFFFQKIVCENAFSQGIISILFLKDPVFEKKKWESEGNVLINSFATWGHYQMFPLFPSPATSAAL